MRLLNETIKCVETKGFPKRPQNYKNAGYFTCNHTFLHFPYWDLCVIYRDSVTMVTSMKNYKKKELMPGSKLQPHLLPPLWSYCFFLKQMSVLPLFRWPLNLLNLIKLSRDTNTQTLALGVNQPDTMQFFLLGKSEIPLEDLKGKSTSFLREQAEIQKSWAFPSNLLFFHFQKQHSFSFDNFQGKKVPSHHLHGGPTSFFDSVKNQKMTWAVHQSDFLLGTQITQLLYTLGGFQIKYPNGTLKKKSMYHKLFKLHKESFQECPYYCL